MQVVGAMISGSMSRRLVAARPDATKVGSVYRLEIVGHYCVQAGCLISLPRPNPFYDYTWL